MAGTKSTRSSDPRFNHVVSDVFNGDPRIMSVLSILGIKTWRPLIKLLKDHNKIRSVKWRNGQTQSEEDLPEELKEELIALPSYLNWLQNNYGPLPDHPIDVTAQTSRSSFIAFVMLDPDERGGEVDGTVKYDVGQARESAKHNLLGIYAPPPAPPVQVTAAGGNNTTGVVNNGGGINYGSSLTDAERELAAFDKNPPSDKEVNHLLRNSGWKNYSVEMRALFRIKGIEHLFTPSYQPPILAQGDEQAAVTLFERRNTAVFTILFRTVKSSDGSIIVKKYQISMDGISAWKDLEDFHTKDMSAKNRVTQLLRLIAQTRLRQDSPKGVAPAMDEWKGWVREHNELCDPSSEINAHMQLNFLECYLGNIVALKDCKIRILENEAQFQRIMAPTDKMDLYYRSAQSIDEDKKVSTIQNLQSQRRTLANVSEMVSEMDLYDDYDKYSQNLEVNLQEQAPDVNSSDIEGEVYRVYLSSLRDVYRAYQRKTGYAPSDIYGLMDKKQQDLWMGIKPEIREKLLTCLHSGNPPPPNTSDPQLPGTGIASRKARATNAAETELSTAENESVSEDIPTREASMTSMTYIQAMQARARNTKPHKPALQKYDALLPGRLMSTQNKSPNQLEPIHRIGADPTDIIPVRNASVALSRPMESTNLSRLSSNVNIRDTMAAASFPDLLGEPPVAPVRRFASMAQLHQDTSSEGSAGHDVTHVTLHDYYRTLVDGGANNGFGNSNEMRLLSYASPSRHVCVSGIGGIDIPEVQIGTFAAKIRLDDGRFVLGICHEYGEIECGNSIHSKIQLQDGGCEVFDDSVLLGGRQCLVHKDGSIIPFDIHQGLPYIRMIYPSDDDLQNLPRITMTSDSPWNPSMYDNSVPDYNVMGHTNDIVQSVTVNSGENGNQRNHLSAILRSPNYNVADVFTRRLLPQHLELYIHTDNVAVNHAERSRFLSSRRRVEPAPTDTLYGNSFADRQSHLYLDDVVFIRTYRYTDDETIQVLPSIDSLSNPVPDDDLVDLSNVDFFTFDDMNPQDPGHNVD